MNADSKTFTCFGGACTLVVEGKGPAGAPPKAVVKARDNMLAWHAQFTRFKPDSELSSLNADPHERVSVSPMMARFVQAAVDAANATGGLVDATLLEAIEEAGYRKDHLQGTFPLPLMVALAPPRQPGGPHPSAHWRELVVDLEECAVTRPPGVKLDGGGLVKGLFADAVADMLAKHASFTVDCVGDLRVGGSAGVARKIPVTAPFGGRLLHELTVSDGAVATSGIHVRSWLGPGGKPAHHLLDPATGRPAYTGVVQVTALAPTGLEGEWRAKAAILSGPEGAPGWLPHGGVIVFDDGSHAVIDAA